MNRCGPPLSATRVNPLADISPASGFAAQGKKACETCIAAML